MDALDPTSGWQTYALTGRPDFLNYLQRGDVTWRRLWTFYHENPADTDVMVRLMGLFHAFLSQDYDREGCILHEHCVVYADLKDWARFVVDHRDWIPEEKLRASLAALLGQSLISSLYYEAAFSVYLEALIGAQAREWAQDAAPRNGLRLRPAVRAPERRLAIRLPELPRYPELQGRPHWEETVATLVQRHYEEWNRAYVLAIGEEEADWLDEGGEG